MKILLSFLQDAVISPHPIPAYRFWHYYIKNGIEEAGYQWLEIPKLDWAEGLTYSDDDPDLGAWKQSAWEKTIKYIKQNRPSIDIFLCYLYPRQIDKAAIQEIRRLGIPCVNFYCDHVRQFKGVPDEFKVFNLIWVPEYEALSLYKNSRTPYIHLPMPMWVAPKYRNCAAVENRSISFIGSKDRLREELLATAIQKGLPVEVRGSGWSDSDDNLPINAPVTFTNKLNNQAVFLRRHGFSSFLIYHLQKFENKNCKYVPDLNIFDKPDFENYIDLTRQSMITLGINRVPTFKTLNRNPLVYSRLRDIEAPMLGACYLTEYTEGLNSLYKLGEEIETYSNIEELLYKCKEISNSPAKRKALRSAGQKQALHTHAIAVSLQKLKIRVFD